MCVSNKYKQKSLLLDRDGVISFEKDMSLLQKDVFLQIVF